MAVEIPTPIDTKTSLEHAVQSATNTLHGWYARRVASGKSPITRAAMHTRLLAVWPRVSPDVAGQIIDEVMGIERAPEAAPVYEPERGLRRSDLLANSIIKDTNGERTRVQVAVSQANHPEQHMQCSAAYAWHSIASIAAVGHFNAEGKTKPYTAAEIIEAAGILCEHYTSQVKAPGA